MFKQILPPRYEKMSSKSSRIILFYCPSVIFINWARTIHKFHILFILSF